MSNVWYAIPSAKHPRDWSTLPLWRLAGYKIAVFRDEGMKPLPVADINVFGAYAGYPAAVNELVRKIFKVDDPDWIVTGGDDIKPDPTRVPWEIADECTEYFNGTFGIMQPTGDQDHMQQNGTCAAERVCESPWMGREWCDRAYGGRGPIWEEYFHFFEDEDLHEVAKRLGVLWHRPDVNQYHHHWTREGKRRPEYLDPAKLNWHDAKALFEKRKAAGFPGHGPLPFVPRAA